MRVHLVDLPAGLADPVAVALGGDVVVSLAEQADLLLLGAAQPETALAQMAAFAAQAPQTLRLEADQGAGGQVIWLLPAGRAEALTGALRHAARTHAPGLRVNAIHLGPRRPTAPPWQAAWGAAQPRPAPLSPAKSLAAALTFLIASPALTGQILHLPDTDNACYLGFSP